MPGLEFYGPSKRGFRLDEPARGLEGEAQVVERAGAVRRALGRSFEELRRLVEPFHLGEKESQGVCGFVLFGIRIEDLTQQSLCLRVTALCVVQEGEIRFGGVEQVVDL